MHICEVTPGIYKIFSSIASLKTYSSGYFSKQQNETDNFFGMTLYHVRSSKYCFTGMPSKRRIRDEHGKELVYMFQMWL